MTKVIIILAVWIITALMILEGACNLIEMKRVTMETCQAPDNVTQAQMGCE